MKILRFVSGLLQVNTYFLVTENNDAIMIDGGERIGEAEKFIADNSLCVKYELLTHAHFDHSSNASYFQKKGVLLGISKIDAEKLALGETLASSMGKKPITAVPDFVFSDGDQLDLLGIKIKVLLTPGHTDGSACFIVEDNLFSGDILFRETVGRSDFPTGNFDALVQSVKKLFELPDNTKVFPGHNEITDISHEKKYNPINEYL